LGYRGADAAQRCASRAAGVHDLHRDRAGGRATMEQSRRAVPREELHREAAVGGDDVALVGADGGHEGERGAEENRKGPGASGGCHEALLQREPRRRGSAAVSRYASPPRAESTTKTRTKEARIEAGVLLRRLQEGEALALPLADRTQGRRGRDRDRPPRPRATRSSAVRGAWRCTIASPAKGRSDERPEETSPGEGRLEAGIG
jgi:hypothetical protein